MPCRATFAVVSPRWVAVEVDAFLSVAQRRLPVSHELFDELPTVLLTDSWTAAAAVAARESVSP